ncbi:hypothetical protein Hanom_Chr13g01184911 [Helianthus anomalus]
MISIGTNFSIPPIIKKSKRAYQLSAIAANLASSVWFTEEAEAAGCGVFA